MKILSAQISQSALTIVIIVLLSKRTSIEFVGLFGVYSALINSMYQFFKLGIPKIILASASEINVRSYVQLGALLSLSLFTLGGMIAYSVYLADDVYSLGFGVASNLAFFVFLLLYRSLQLIREVYHAFYLKNENIDIYWNSMFYGNITALLVFGTILLFADKPAFGFAGASLSLLIFSLVDYKVIFSKTKDNSKEKVKISYSSLLKVALADFLNSFKTSLPRILIADVLSYSIAGVYTAIQQAVALLEVLNQVFLKQFNRDIVTSIRNGSKQMFFKTAMKIFGLIFLVFSLSFIVCYFFGEILLTIAFSDEYAEYKSVLLWLVAIRALDMIGSLPKFVLIVRNKIFRGVIASVITFAVFIPFMYGAQTITDFFIILFILEIVYISVISNIGFRKIARYHE
jgi:O-antigen/teichoic acid export membrane protein